MSIDPKIQLYVKSENEAERKTSDTRYAPYLAWTVLIGFMGLIATAVLVQMLKLIGL